MHMFVFMCTWMCMHIFFLMHMFMYIMFMYLFMYLFACIRVYCYYVESCEHDRAVMSCEERTVLGRQNHGRPSPTVCNITWILRSHWKKISKGQSNTSAFLGRPREAFAHPSPGQGLFHLLQDSTMGECHCQITCCHHAGHLHWPVVGPKPWVAGWSRYESMMVWGCMRSK
jgi:Ca2+/Na+ antiporter